jgi:hypothetical protein
MLEQFWHKLHDPAPKGMGFHIPGNSCNPKFQDAKLYRDNLAMNNTGGRTRGSRWLLAAPGSSSRRWP